MAMAANVVELEADLTLQVAADTDTQSSPSDSISNSKENDAGDTTSKPKNSKCHHSEGQFSDPVYKHISLRNGEINKMNKDTLKKRLSEHHLETRGVKEVLKKRLKNFFKKKKWLASGHAGPPAEDQQLYEYILVIDFEATCQEHSPSDFHNEIIEFPIVLINVEQMAVEGEFHAYCRPLVNPQLSEFCTKLTGITQETVDQAKPFCEVLADVEQWKLKWGLGTTRRFAVLTDGPWDMGRFMAKQCKLSGVPHPKWAENWVNLRKSYGNFYDCKRCGLAAMLQNLEYEFEGQPHSGIDDARNIARVAVRMLQDGAVLKENEKLSVYQLQQSKIKERNLNGNPEKEEPQINDLNIQKPMSELNIRKQELDDLKQ